VKIIDERVEHFVIVKLSRVQVNSWRLSKHHLLKKARKGEMAKVVSDVCGIQAQVLSAAELALRARVERLCQQDVRDGLWKAHSILKTWCMRGTLHLLASSDLPTYVSALRSKLVNDEVWLEKNHGVRPSEVEVITTEIERALTSRTLTREDLTRSVASQIQMRSETEKVLKSAWGILLRPAAYQGALAFGPSVGPKVTFLRPDRWINDWEELSVEDALNKLFRKYLRCYGPVTLRDFAHWWGNLSGVESSILERSRIDLEEVEVEGHNGLMLKSDAREAAGRRGEDTVRLLPSFDCYAMFYSPRELFVLQSDRSKIFRKTAGWNYPSVLVDGCAAGIWNLKRRGRRIRVEIEPFRVLDKIEREGVEEEVADIGRFLGASAEVHLLPLSRP
jgi:hypothetical protein